MDRKNFNRVIFAEFDKYKQSMLSKNVEDVFNNATEIDKMMRLRDYLTDAADSFVEDLMPYVDGLLEKLSDFECDYDVPMYIDWDDIEDMTGDFIEAMESANH